MEDFKMTLEKMDISHKYLSGEDKREARRVYWEFRDLGFFMIWRGMNLSWDQYAYRIALINKEKRERELLMQKLKNFI